MRHTDASYFNPKEEVGVIHRQLPHWDQAGTYAFVTFRLNDSLPRQLVHQLTKERAELLSAAGIDPEVVAFKAESFRRNELLSTALDKLPDREASRLRWRLFAAWDAKLDKVCGQCWLRKSDASRIVSDGLLKFDNDRYTMAAFVIMPNHVHLLAAFREPGMITTQGAEWRRFFAREINAMVGSSGHFWQEDQFDHLVRSEVSFDRIRRYIIDNPEKAKLRCGEYRLYVSPEL
jgi:putative transposase